MHVRELFPSYERRFILSQWEAACDADGRLLAIRGHMRHDHGANTPYGVALPYNAATNHQSGVSLKATQDFDWAQLVSITAYRTSNYRSVLDLDEGVTPGINPFNAASRNVSREQPNLRRYPCRRPLIEQRLTRRVGLASRGSFARPA